MHWICWTLVLDFPVSGTLRNAFLLSVSYPVESILLWKSVWTKTPTQRHSFPSSLCSNMSLPLSVPRIHQTLFRFRLWTGLSPASKLPPPPIFCLLLLLSLQVPSEISLCGGGSSLSVRSGLGPPLSTSLLPCLTFFPLYPGRAETMASSSSCTCHRAWPTGA